MCNNFIWFQIAKAGVGDGLEGHGDSGRCITPAVILHLEDSEAASRATGCSQHGCAPEDEEDDACSLSAKKRRVS